MYVLQLAKELEEVKSRLTIAERRIDELEKSLVQQKRGMIVESAGGETYNFLAWHQGRI